jgi:hypothetical protein
MTLKVNTLYGTFDEEQLKNLKGNIEEVVICMTKIQALNESIADIVNLSFDATKIPKKIIKKMAKVKFKQNFSTEVAESAEFETLYGAVQEVK